MTERIVFVGENGCGREYLIEWFPGTEAEVLYVSTRDRGDRTWGPPVECVKVDR